MAHFLIFRESSELIPVGCALKDTHDLTFAKETQEALILLEQAHFDMIISAVFLESGDMFAFLRIVKETSALKSTPFICFSARRTERARLLNKSLADAALSSGAEAFLQLDDFCEGDYCDLNAIRLAIESALPRRNTPHC